MDELNSRFETLITDNRLTQRQLRKLIDEGFELSYKNNLALHYAEKIDNPELYQFITNIIGLPENALQTMCDDHHPRILTFLIENGADIHYDDDLPLRSLVHIDTIPGRETDSLSHIEKFIRLGANFRANNFLQSLCTLYISRDILEEGNRIRFNVFSLLFSLGLDINVGDGLLLRSALVVDDYELVNFFIKSGIYVDEDAINQANYNNSETLELMVKHGADIFTIPDNRDTRTSRRLKAEQRQVRETLDTRPEELGLPFDEINLGKLVGDYYVPMRFSDKDTLSQIHALGFDHVNSGNIKKFKEAISKAYTLLN